MPLIEWIKDAIHTIASRIMKLDAKTLLQFIAILMIGAANSALFCLGAFLLEDYHDHHRHDDELMNIPPETENETRE